MKYSEKFGIQPGKRVRLAKFNTAFDGKSPTKKSAMKEMAGLQKETDQLQFRLYAEQKQSLLICLQGLDAGGKDGVVRHVIGCMNPQGCRVVSFKQPTAEELAHDFLWRVEQQAPKQGEVVVFNRSHYEDVLIVRVHNLVPEPVWSERYRQINEFEQRLAGDGTHILKFFLHISKEEQLERFKRRLDDPERQWKISEADYKERAFWSSYQTAYEEVLSKCNTKEAPWFVIPSDQKWFRNLAIAQIIAQKMKSLHIKVPKASVDIEAIRRKYHAAEAAS